MITKSLKRKILIISFILIVAIVVIFFVVKSKGDNTEYVLADIKLGSLNQTVSEVGTIKASEELDLNFLQTGKIGKIFVSIGDKVEKGKILIELDYSSLSIQEKEAQASLEIANANLNKLLRGATNEDIAVTQSSVNQTKAAYDSVVREENKIKVLVNENTAQADKNYNNLISVATNDITPEEQAVASAQINLDNTIAVYQKSIENYRDTVLTTINNYLTVSNTALDKIDTILNDNDAKQVLSVKNTTYLLNTQDTYNEALTLLSKANTTFDIAEANKVENNITNAVTEAFLAFNKVYDSLSYCYDALENTIPSSTFTQAELDTYKTSISAHLTSVNTGISSVQISEQNYLSSIITYDTKVLSANDNLNQANVNLQNAIKNAKDYLATTIATGDQQIAAIHNRVDSALEAWDVARAQLVKLKAPPRVEDISLARAQIKQAEASLELIRKRIEESIIKAPIDGIVIKIENRVGEQVNASVAPIAMIGENNFEIEVDISEADIAKINHNDSVEITLDAYGEDKKFYGRVYFIEPAETVIQEIIYYKVKIKFDDVKANDVVNIIKSGMTANILITTAEKSNVLVMPTRAIIEKNGDGKFVRLYEDGIVKEVLITVGLRGDDGMVEVISGVKEGEQVVTYVNSGK